MPIGQKFGYLTIIEDLGRLQRGKQKARIVIAVCECGNMKEYFFSNIKRGTTTSCGECLLKRSGKIKDLTGQKFNRWTVIKLVPREGKRKDTRWECVCDCGKIGKVNASNLIRGVSTSCGCLGMENMKKAVTFHGLTNHPLHGIWSGMLARCNNPNNPRYKYYGGRGVRVCKEWEDDFINFYKWAIENGWQKGLQVDKDKKAKELGIEALVYSPERCTLLTPKENARHTRKNRIITCRGMTMTLAEFAELVGEKSDIIHYRIRHGWTEEEAIFTPFKRRKNDKSKTRRK